MPWENRNAVVKNSLREKKLFNLSYDCDVKHPAHVVILIKCENIT